MAGQSNACLSIVVFLGAMTFTCFVLTGVVDKLTKSQIEAYPATQFELDLVGHYG